MRIATWNVNSIRQRMDCLQAWLKEREPDIVCLQEVKCTDDAFPREPIEALGYNVAVHGQKTWNGVALLSKLPFDEVAPGLMGDDGDAQARFLEALVSTFPMAMAERKNTPTNSNGWTDWSSFRLNGLNWKNRWCWRAITTSSLPRSTPNARRPGSTMRCS
jgi:exodeoxyribonuclease III